LSLIVAPACPKSFDIPAAQDATDKELARINSQSIAAQNRLQWESNAILLGGIRPR
jgi:hypothetical protein